MKKNIIIWGVILLLIIGALVFFSSNPSTKNAQDKKGMNNSGSETVKQIQEEVGSDMKTIGEKLEKGEITKEEAEKQMLNTITNSSGMQMQFEKQKVLMPKYVQLMKENISCLEDANTKSDVKSCGEKMEAKAKAMGLPDEEDYDEENDIPEWTAAEKAKTLSDMRTDLKQIEKTNQCLQTSKDMMSAIKCSEPDLK